MPQRGAQKRKTAVFSLKSHFAWRKSATKFMCENCQRQSYRAFIGLTIHAKIIGGGRPLLPEIFGSNWPHWSEIANFRSIFVRSALAVNLAKKVQLSLIGSPLRAFQWAQDEHRTLSLSPQGWLKNAKCPKFELQAAITPQRYKIGCQLPLITNGKSHTGFRLVPTSMTLNNLKRRNSPHFAFFTEF